MNWIDEVNAEYQARHKKIGLPVEQVNLDVLTERQREVLRLRYGEKLTLRAIGEKFGVSGEMARQIIVKAFKDMYWLKRK